MAIAGIQIVGLAASSAQASGQQAAVPSSAQGVADAAHAAVAVKPGQAARDNEQVKQVMEEVKQAVEARAPNSLSFSIDDSSGKVIVKVTDAATGEIVRQIPSEEMLEIARSIDKMQGLLLKEKA
jgi:flagellar protein FlaG